MRGRCPYGTDGLHEPVQIGLLPVRVVGPTAYVAADFFGLGLLDVSNPAAPVLRGSFKTPGQAKNVGVFGTKVVVADHMSGVDYIDVSDAAKPASLGSFFVDGYARDAGSSSQNWDVFPGGKEFLMVRQETTQAAVPQMVLNWQQLMSRARGAAAP